MQILAISGSLRAGSTNSNLLRAAASLAPKHVKFTFYDGLADLPHFSPELDGDNPPASYVERILLVTADYQRGLPLSEKTIAARQKDLTAYQLQMQRHQQELKQTQDLERERKKQERGRGLSR